jgi:hypothetical protein
METLIRVFMTPLRKESRLISSKNIDEIFGNIEQIATINRSLLERLQEKMKSFDDETTTVGELFIEMVICFSNVLFLQTDMFCRLPPFDLIIQLIGKVI